MYLRDLAICADKRIVDRCPGGFVRRFHRDTCCVSELYLKLIHRKVLTEDTAKVVVEMTDMIDAPPSANTMRSCLGVLELQWPFSFTEYLERHAEKKRQMIAEALHESLLWVSSRKKWPTEAFEEAYAEALARGLRFEGFWRRKSWHSPKGQFRAKLYYEYGLEWLKLFVVVVDRRNQEISRLPLDKFVPECGVLQQLVGEGRWRDDNVFELQTDSGFWRGTRTCDLSSLIDK